MINEETPLQKAVKLAKEKEQASSPSNPYKDMSYEDYVSQRDLKKKDLSSTNSKNGSATSGTPSVTSPQNNFVIQDKNPLQVAADEFMAPDPTAVPPGVDDLNKVASINEQIRNSSFKALLAKQTNPEAQSILQSMDMKDAEWAAKSPMLRMQERYTAAGGEEKYHALANKVVEDDAKTKARIKENAYQEAKYQNVGFGTDFEKNTARYIRGGIGQLVGSAGKTLTETASGALNIVRDVAGSAKPLYDEAGNKTAYADNIKLSDGLLDNLILGIDGMADMSNAMIADETLPNTTMGRLTTSMAQIATDVAAMVFAPEVRGVQALGDLNKVKNLVWNPFTKYMIAKGGLSGYGNAKREGGDGIDAAIGGAEGALSGGVSGATVGILGGIAGNFSKALTSDLTQAGVIGLDSHLTKAGIRALSEAVAFGGAPIIETYAKASVTGEDVDRKALMDEMVNQMGVGLAFGIKAGVKEFGNSKTEYASYRELIDNVLPRMQQNAFESFLRADIKTIGKIATEISEPGDLHAKGIELITKSEREADAGKRNEMLANAALNMKLADIKGVTEVIINNKQEIIDFIRKSEITQEAKDVAVQKIDEVSQLLSETGQQRTVASQNLEEATVKAEKLADDLINATGPSDIQRIKSEAEAAGKQGIDATEVLKDVTVKEGKEAEPTPPPAVGDQITFPNEAGEEIQGFVKELLPNNKAIVASAVEGIYKEHEIELPKAETQPAVSKSPVPEPIADPIPEPVIQAEAPTIEPPVVAEPVLAPENLTPKKPSRTSKELERPPASFQDAANQFYLSGNKLSTEDFVRHTGFGFFKEADGIKTKLTPAETDEYLTNGSLQSGEVVKMSDELRKAKFTGKVTDKSKGGLDADMILQNHIPAEFSGDQDMNGVTEIVNLAANRTKGQMLSDLESSNIERVENPEIENFGYTDAEIAEMEAIDNAVQTNLTDAEITALENQDKGELIQSIHEELSSMEITDKQAADLLNLTKQYTNDQGEVDWNALEQKYFDNFISETDADFEILPLQGVLKQIFENGNEQIKPTNGSKSDLSNVSSEENSQVAGGGSEGTESEVQSSDSRSKIEVAEQSVQEQRSLVSSLQNEVNRINEKLSKNLKENQADMFGNNKTQSLFDDKADQQKILTDKVAELKTAQESLLKASNDLSTLKETEGQVELTLPDPKVEIDGKSVDLSKTNETEDAQIMVKAFINPLQLISAGQKLVDKLENATTAKFIPKVTDYIAEKLKAWRTSKSSMKQVASSYASSILGGIARSDKDINMKLGLIGGKNMAIHNMGKVMKSLYGIVDNNTESLERIHVVLDPDFYQIGLGGQANAAKPNVPPNLVYNDLTPEEKMLFDEVRKNLDDIHFKNYALGFISVDTFNAHKGTYVPRMYETFELPSDIQEELDKYQDQVGDKLNLNPFKKRKGLDALSDESKNAVLKDPVYLMAKRLMELDTNSAIMTYINHVNRNNKSLIYKGAPENAPFNYQQLEGKAYGALDGKFVPSYIAEDLRGYFFVNKGLNNVYDVIKGYDRTWSRQAVKKGLTVFNPFVQLGNFTSNVVFAQMAGIDFVRWFGNSPKAIKSLKAKDQDYEDLLSAGLVGSDILAKDLAPNTERANSLLQTAQAKKDASLLRKLMTPLTKANDAAMDLYSGNDDYAKINAYQILKEQGYSKEEATKKIYDGFQNYATVGKFWDVVSKTPVFGNPFMKFSADLTRITGNAAAKKPLSTALYIAALYMIPQLLQQLGVSDDNEDALEKELRESRPFIPKMDLGVVNIPLVYKTKFGELNLARYLTPYYFFDNGEDGALSSMASRFNPYKSVKSEGYGKGNEKSIPFGQDPVLGTLYNIMMDTDFRGKSIQDPEATRFRASGITEEQKWTNRATNALRTWIPNGSLIHDTYLNSKYGEDFYGRSRTMAQTLINFAVKIQDFKDSDYKKTAEKQVYSFTNDLKSQTETIKNTYVNDARKRQKAQESFKDGKIDQTDYQNQIEKMDAALKDRLEIGFKQQKEIHQKLNEFTKKYERILKQ